jgi:hypothetical protein
MKNKDVVKIINVIAFVLFLLSPNFIVKSQEQGLDTNGLIEGEISNCFDVYKFQNISINSGLDQGVYKPYDMLEINANIVNNNPYPVIDATVRAKVLRNHPNPVDKKAQYITVDDIVIADNLILKPNEEYSIEYDYFISGNAPSGEYIIQYYIYNQDRFNLAGLSFTEDVIGNQMSFIVEGKNEHIYLDKTNITIDGQSHNTRGFMTQHTGNKIIPVKIPLVNPENINREIEINYKLYKWDELLESNLLDQKTQQISISGNNKVELNYDIEAKEDTVYYMVITSTVIGEDNSEPNKMQSMAHIRFSIEDKNSPRINWVGLNKYPAQKGEDLQFMVCAHNKSYGTDNGPIKIFSKVTDSSGKVLSNIRYEGRMPSAISGLSNKFKANGNLNTINIETSLYNANDDLVDNINTTYNCKDINPELCSNRSLILNIIIIISSISAIIIAGLVFIRYNKLKK